MKTLKIHRKIIRNYRRIIERLNFLLKTKCRVDIIIKKNICYFGEEDQKMYSAIDIANWFLSENRRRMVEEDSDYITHLKLQKLLYYAQGCYLAIKNKPLFKENILAWAHGPVVYEVYQEFKQYGSNPIEFLDDYNNNIDIETQGILKEVFDTFGQYSAWKLRQMTHEEAPWLKTPRNEIIDKEIIKDFFEREYIE